MSAYTPPWAHVQKQVVQTPSTPPQTSFDLQDYKVISDIVKVPVLQPYNIRGVFKTGVRLQLWITGEGLCKLGTWHLFLRAHTSKRKGPNYVRILKQKWKPASSSLLEANEILFKANSKQTILHTAKGYWRTLKEQELLQRDVPANINFISRVFKPFHQSRLFFFFFFLNHRILNWAPSACPN